MATKRKTLTLHAALPEFIEYKAANASRKSQISSDSDKFPLIWTCLGLVVFCGTVWTLIGYGLAYCLKILAF